MFENPLSATAVIRYYVESRTVFFVSVRQPHVSTRSTVRCDLMSVLSSFSRDNDQSMSSPHQSIPPTAAVSASLSAAVFDGKLLVRILSFSAVRDKFVRCIALNRTFHQHIQSADSLAEQPITLTPPLLEFIKARRPRYFQRVIRVDRVDDELDDGDESTFEYDYATIADVFPNIQSYEYRCSFHHTLSTEHVRAVIESFAQSQRQLRRLVMTVSDKWECHLFTILCQNSAAHITDLVIMLVWPYCDAKQLLSIISNCPNVTRLVVGIETKAFLYDFIPALASDYKAGHLRKLNALEILHPKEDGSLADLAAVTTLRKLRVVEVNYAALPPLTSFPSLSDLSRVILNSTREVEQFTTFRQLRAVTIMLAGDEIDENTANSLVQLHRLQILALVVRHSPNHQVEILQPLMAHVQLTRTRLWPSLHTLMLSHFSLTDETTQQLVTVLPQLITLDLKSVTTATILSIYHLTKLQHLMILTLHYCTDMTLTKYSITKAQELALNIYQENSITNLSFPKLKSFCWSGNNSYLEKIYTSQDLFLCILHLFNTNLIYHFHIEFKEQNETDLDSLQEQYRIEELLLYTFPNLTHLCSILMFKPFLLTLDEPQRDAWSHLLSPYRHWRREGHQDGAVDEVHIDREPLAIEWCDVVDMHRCQGNDHRVYADGRENMLGLLRQAYQQCIQERSTQEQRT